MWRALMCGGCEVMAKIGAACPICSKPIDPGFRPFCSKRCADIDLHRWFSGRYAIPAEHSEQGEEEGPADLPGDEAR